MSELTKEREDEIRRIVSGSQWDAYKREWFMQAIFDLLGGYDQLRADLAAANERERLMLEIPEIQYYDAANPNESRDRAARGANWMRDKFRAILTDAGNNTSTKGIASQFPQAQALIKQTKQDQAVVMKRLSMDNTRYKSPDAGKGSK